MEPRRDGGSLSLRSDPRRVWTAFVSANQVRGAGGHSTRVEFGIGYKPAPNWSISLEPEWRAGRSEAQYLTSIEDPQVSTTFGRRYVFAELEQTELSLAARLDVTFTPALSLEIFARPFLGSGRFGIPKELAVPRRFRDGVPLTVEGGGSGESPC